MIVALGQDDEQRRRQRMRSVAIALALGGLVVLFYVATIVRLGPNALRKDGVSRTNPAAATAPQTEPGAPAADCKKAGTC